VAKNSHFKVAELKRLIEIARQVTELKLTELKTDKHASGLEDMALKRSIGMKD
jgi:hypothetical protein